MAKIIKMVQDVISRARSSSNNEAKQGSYRARWDGSELSLYHYGTLIFRAFPRRVEQLGGWSKSDQDAINTALDYMGLNYFVSTSDKWRKQSADRINGWYLVPN